MKIGALSQYTYFVKLYILFPPLSITGQPLCIEGRGGTPAWCVYITLRHAPANLGRSGTKVPEIRHLSTGVLRLPESYTHTPGWLTLLILYAKRLCGCAACTATHASHPLLPKFSASEEASHMRTAHTAAHRRWRAATEMREVSGRLRVMC